MNPLVSVLMPVYNGQEHLEEAIESILNQTYENFEFLILNDGSTDNSEKIILSFQDKRIVYIKNDINLKLIDTLNKGVGLAKGKYIIRMDADDVSLNKRIDKQVLFMEENPEIGVSGTWFESFGKERKLTKYSCNPTEVKYKMLFQSHLNHPSTIWRKSLLNSLDLLFDKRYIHAEDYEFFSRISWQSKISNIPEVLLKYRLHDASVSFKHNDVQAANSDLVRFRAFEKMGLKLQKEELASFKALNYHNYFDISIGPNRLKKLLLDISKSNMNTKFIEPDFLETKLSFLFYHYCLQTKNKSVFFSSKFHTGISNFEKLKLILRF